MQSTYWKGFLIAFVCALGVLSVVMAATVLAVQPSMPQEEPVSEDPGFVYHPDATDSLTLLVIGQGEEQADFLLIRFNPQHGQVPLSLIPPDLQVLSETGSTTLNQLYQDSGALAAKTALSQALGIVVDRYARIQPENFLRIAKKTGTVLFTIPYDISYSRDGFQVSIPAGERRLDGQDVLDMFAYPPFQRNPLEKSQVMGDLVAAVVNQHMESAQEEYSATLFKLAINLIDTDLNYADYELRRRAADFLANLNAQVCANFPAQGSYSGDGSKFHPSEDYLELLSQYFEPLF